MRKHRCEVPVMSKQPPLFPSLPEPTAAVVDEGGRIGTPRVLVPVRNQLELRPIDLEATLGPEHPARSVWAFVERLDLSTLYEAIGSRDGGGGRPAIDPRILVTLWLYATIDGVGSARAVARLCAQHDAYRWICGGVSVNHHTLSDFRVGQVEFLDALLGQGVAVLMHKGLVELNRVAQDGMRVRASAGAASFRRRSTLQDCLKAARTQVERLRQELGEDPGSCTRAQQAARERARQEREQRLDKALEELERLEKKKKKPKPKKPDETEEAHAKRTEARASSTDPEARVMKMADGGFRPAYNVQFCTDTETQVIVGVDVNNIGSDMGQLTPMLEQLEARYGQLPGEALVDGGYANTECIARAHARGVAVYAPVSKPKDPGRDPYAPRPTDSAGVAQWRERMGTEAAKQIYPERAATAECVNAIARQRGLQRFAVRGQRKVLAVALWYAVAHNLMRALTFHASKPA